MVTATKESLLQEHLGFQNFSLHCRKAGMASQNGEVLHSCVELMLGLIRKCL